MINPNSKRGRAMLLAAQAQERPAAPTQPAAVAARPPLRENPARSYSLGDDDWGARRPVAKVQRPAAAHDARARREARRQAVAAQAPAPAPEPVVIKPVVPEEPVVPKEAGPPGLKKVLLARTPAPVFIDSAGRDVRGRGLRVGRRPLVRPHVHAPAGGPLGLRFRCCWQQCTRHIKGARRDFG